MVFSLLGSTRRQISSDESGSVAVMAAFLTPVIIGGLGLGAEVGYWYFKERQLQHAADLSAHAAGTRKRAGDTGDELRDVALHIAGRVGFDAESGSLAVFAPPEAGENAGNRDALEIRLTREIPRLFSAIFSNEPVLLNARAVALIRDGNEACVLALSATASGGVTLSGSSLVELENCDVASNSLASDSILMSGGSAALTAGCIYAVGEIVETTRLTLTECEDAKEYAPVTADPYATVPEPSAFAHVTCTDGNIGSSAEVTVAPSYVLEPGVYATRFCGGLSIQGTVTFEPGVYIIDGGTFSANAGAVIQGEGVTFFLTGGATARLNGHAALDLSPPTTGPYSGLTFFGSRDASGLTHQVNGTSGSIIEGAVYFPSSHIQFSGNSKTGVGGGCTQVIGDTVELTGNSSLRSSCEASGTRDLLANRFVRLVE